MKLKKLVICAALASAVCLTAAGCGGRTPGGEKIDPHKTQLYVYNFAGGYGSDWLTALKTRFEEKHKNDTNWEEGKTGVQVFVSAEKDSISDISSQILNNKEEVYFSEYAYYYTLKSQGVLGDITEAVTDKLTEYDESESIEDKLSREQKEYFGVSEGGGVKYYGVPHYAGYDGIVYNVDLFEKEGYYFAKTPSDNTRDGRFIDRYNTVKSAGPDGVEGTFDDGLPATYEEFFTLLSYIKDGGTTPVIWNGFNYQYYLQRLAQALQVNYEGVDQSMLNYTLRGEAKTLATVEGGNVSISAGEEVNDSTAWKLSKQAGKYYALDFLYQLVTNNNYHNDLAFNPAYSHLDAQEDFINAGEDGKTKPAAMLVDGVWWQSEAGDAFDRMVAVKGENYNEQNRNFAFMPLPKATREKVNETANASADSRYMLYDSIFSLCFMKANVADWKRPLAIDFIKFANTDESLNEFTKITNTVKALNYTVNDETKAQLTPFGKSLVQIKDASQVVYPFSANSVYLNNQSFFQVDSAFRTTVGSKDHQFPAIAMRENNVSAENYFKGMATYYQKNWIVK